MIIYVPWHLKVIFTMWYLWLLIKKFLVSTWTQDNKIKNICEICIILKNGYRSSCSFLTRQYKKINRKECCLQSCMVSRWLLGYPTYRMKTNLGHLLDAYSRTLHILWSLFHGHGHARIDLIKIKISGKFCLY